MCDCPIPNLTQEEQRIIEEAERIGWVCTICGIPIHLVCADADPNVEMERWEAVISQPNGRSICPDCAAEIPHQPYTAS